MIDRKIITVVGLLSLPAISLAAYGQTGITAATNDPKTEAVVDASGNLRVPADYRAVYQFLGSWAVAADQGQGSKEIHVVYAAPDTIAAYRKDGRFPDGSVLVKEFLVPAGNQELILTAFQEQEWSRCIDDPLCTRGTAQRGTGANE